MSNLKKIVGIRVTDTLYSKLRDVSKARGEDVSDFVRRAILKELAGLGFLSPEQDKALGVKTTR